jgi:hypothetical protein
MDTSPTDAQNRLRELGIPFSENALFDHIKSGDSEIVDLLISAGIRATARNRDGVSAIAVACATGNTATVQALLDRGAALGDVVRSIQVRSKEKDFWDKLSSVAPVATIASGLVVAAIGGWFTQSYNKAQLLNLQQQQSQDKQLREVDVVEKMIPHLEGDERSKEASLAAISILTDTELSTKLAEVYKGDGSVDFLQDLIVSGTSSQKEKDAALQAIVHVLDSNRPAIVKVSSGDQWTTGFVAESSNGHSTVITAAYRNQTGAYMVETWDAQSFPARLDRTRNNIAYLSVDGPDLKSLKPSSTVPTKGTRIIGVGFIAGRGLNLQIGTVLSIQNQEMEATYEGSNNVLKGFGGAPILDSNGDVMGIAYSFRSGVHIIERYTVLN